MKELTAPDGFSEERPEMEGCAARISCWDQGRQSVGLPLAASLLLASVSTSSEHSDAELDGLKVHACVAYLAVDVMIGGELTAKHRAAVNMLLAACF